VARKLPKPGEQEIAHFWNLYRRFKKFLDKEDKTFNL